jgi:glycosyltransferase involved in cell wall biosynthesis
MACETPVVATDVASVPEVVVDGETGVIVPPRDSGAIAAAALALIHDPERIRRLGSEGRRSVIRRHTPGLLANAHVQAFEGALRHKTSRDGSR